MSTTLDKIAANPEAYSCKVEVLGECKIDSPVNHHEFIGDGERIIVSENESYMRYLEKRLGHIPTFERAAI